MNIGEEPGALLIKIPVPRALGPIAGWGFGLAAWVASTTLLAGLLEHATLANRIAALALWLVPGAALAVGLLYRLVGRDVIRLTKTHLEIRHALLGLASVDRIDVEGIRALRHFPIAAEARLYGLPAGGLAYEYAGGTRWFGEGVSAADAERLVTAFQRRFRLPQLSATAPTSAASESSELL